MALGDTDQVKAYRRFLKAAGARRELELISICTPDVRLWTPLTAIWQIQLGGYDGIVAWIQRMSEEWAFLEATPLSAEERDGGWLLGHGVMRGRGKASPSELEFEIHHALHFSGGLVDEFNAFLAADDALARVEGTSDPGRSDPPS